MDYDGITVRKDTGVDHVAEIVLDRPDALNALNTAMAESIAEACADLGGDPGVRAVVLSAAGTKAFCAGADLKERNAMTDAQILRQREVFRAAFGGVRDLPQPTVAAVHGYALGGGCEFAMSCDIIVADENAVFGLPEVTVGLVPGGGGTQLALRRLGTGLAADLILTGRRVTIDEAYNIGLVARRVPAGEARATAIEVADDDREELAGSGQGREAGAAQRLGRPAGPGARHRGRRLAYRGAVRRPAGGHRGVRGKARPALARRISPASEPGGQGVAAAD